MHWCEVKAVVTGAASGLGLAVAERIVAAGGQVVILDLESGIHKNVPVFSNKQVLTIALDVCDAQAVDVALQQAIAFLGQINLLVNCAGVLHSAKLLADENSLTKNDFEHVIAVNLTATFNLCRAVARVMKNNPDSDSQERGVMINTASIAAEEGQIGQVAYSASKGAVVSMTLPMARELAAFNIRVMAIAPGLFDTDMMREVAPHIQESLTGHMLFPKRLGRPEEFAQLVQQIVENPMLNASVIRLDGGLRMS